VNGEVLVVDAQEQAVGYVPWAVARRALKARQVKMHRRSPPVLMLPPGEHRLPSFRTARKERVMSTLNNPATNNPLAVPAPGAGRPASAMVANWFKFFQEERELWVQNTSSTQVSIQFEIGPGQTAGVLVPVGSDPVCLTNEVPFESIKKSFDLRKLLNRVPGVLRLISAEDAEAYFVARAQAANSYTTDPATGKLVPNVSAAMAEAERLRQASRSVGEETAVVDTDGQVRFTPPRSALELQAINSEAAGNVAEGEDGNRTAAGRMTPQDIAAAGFANGPVRSDQVVRPALLNLCQQVSLQLPKAARMEAKPFFEAIRRMEATLTLEELQYIEAHGNYRTVKKWARDLQAVRNPDGEPDGLEDDLT
jgi:hypothetical protein